MSRRRPWTFLPDEAVPDDHRCPTCLAGDGWSVKLHARFYPDLSPVETYWDCRGCKTTWRGVGS